MGGGAQRVASTKGKLQGTIILTPNTGAKKKEKDGARTRARRERERERWREGERERDGGDAVVVKGQRFRKLNVY